MLWQDFATFAARHLPLGPCLYWHIAPITQKIREGFDLQNWVEQHVDHVVVLPFTRLNLQSVDVDEPRRTVQYTVWLHVGNEEQACARLRAATGGDGESHSIAEVIERIVAWHAPCSATVPDQPLIIDAIVRHTKVYPWGTERHYRESMELFLVPDHAQPQT